MTRLKLVLLLVSAALALLVAGCQQQLSLVGPQPSKAPTDVTSTVDPVRNLTGTWTRIIGDSESVVTFEPDGSGDAWSHVTAPNTPGVTQTYTFSYSIDESVTIDFHEQSDPAAEQEDEVFVIERMSAAAMQVRAVGSSKWMTTGLWVRAE